MQKHAWLPQDQDQNTSFATKIIKYAFFHRIISIY